jgi:hypothetical protein
MAKNVVNSMMFQHIVGMGLLINSRKLTAKNAITIPTPTIHMVILTRWHIALYIDSN